MTLIALHTPPIPGSVAVTPPCHLVDPEMFFAEAPSTIESAKQLCRTCPVRAACLNEAIERAEPHGVWGGELFCRGEVIARKRPRGRPRKNPAPEPAVAVKLSELPPSPLRSRSAASLAPAG